MYHYDACQTSGPQHPCMCSRDVLWCWSCVICAPCWRCAGHVRVNTHAVMRTRRSSWLLPSRVALCSWRPAAVGDLHAQLKGPIGETCKAGKFLTVTTSRISRSLTVGFFSICSEIPHFLVLHLSLSSHLSSKDRASSAGNEPWLPWAPFHEFMYQESWLNQNFSAIFILV